MCNAPVGALSRVPKLEILTGLVCMVFSPGDISGTLIEESLGGLVGNATAGTEPVVVFVAFLAISDLLILLD